MKEGLSSTSLDRRRSENPFAQRNNFYKSFRGYLQLVPPGRPEMLALKDLTQMYTVTAELNLVRAKRRRLGRSRELNSVDTRARRNFNKANVPRLFDDGSDGQRYQNVIRFFNTSILPGLQEAEEAIIKNSTHYQPQQQDEVRAMALRRIAVHLSEYKKDFANTREQLRNKYGTIFE